MKLKQIYFSEYDSYFAQIDNTNGHFYANTEGLNAWFTCSLYQQQVSYSVVLKKHLYPLQKGKNAYDYISEKWEFPGGKIEAGESEEEALKREIFEELSMSILVEKKLMMIDHSYPDFHLTMAVFLCSSKDEPILAEHIHYKWLDPYELGSLDWAAADVPVIDRLIGGV